jgi:hypothetical protein
MKSAQPQITEQFHSLLVHVAYFNKAIQAC